jgi:hypothetical protein
MPPFYTSNCTSTDAPDFLRPIQECRYDVPHIKGGIDDISTFLDSLGRFGISGPGMRRFGFRGGPG